MLDKFRTVGFGSAAWEYTLKVLLRDAGYTTKLLLYFVAGMQKNIFKLSSGSEM